MNRTLELVSTSSDEIRDEHQSKYCDSIGNPVDLGTLLRKPVISLTEGSLAGISGQLLIQRYTCGLYWDINLDAFPAVRIQSRVGNWSRPSLGNFMSSTAWTLCGE